MSTKISVALAVLTLMLLQAGAASFALSSRPSMGGVSMNSSTNASLQATANSGGISIWGSSNSSSNSASGSFSTTASNVTLPPGGGEIGGHASGSWRYEAGSKGGLLYGSSASSSGGEVEFVLYVANVGSSPAYVYTGFPESQVVILSLTGGLVWSSSFGKFYPMIVMQLELKPGENMSWSYAWGLTYDSGRVVPDGSYVALASVMGHSAGTYEIAVKDGQARVMSLDSGFRAPSSTLVGGQAVQFNGTVLRFNVTSHGRVSVIKVDLRHIEAGLFNVSRLMSELRPNGSSFAISENGTLFIAMSSYGQHGKGFGRLFVVNGTQISYYLISNSTGKLREKEILSLEPNPSFLSKLGLTPSGVGIVLSALSSNVTSQVRLLQNATLTGNASLSIGRIRALISEKVGVEKRLVSIIVHSNEEGKVPGFTRGLLQGAEALERAVSTQLNVTEKMGLQIPTSTLSYFALGKGNLTLAQESANSGDYVEATTYAKASMKEFQLALVSDAHARYENGVGELTDNSLVNVTGKIEAAWKIENATAALAARVASSNQTVLNLIVSAKAELDAASSSASAGQYAQANLDVSTALADLRSAFLDMAG